MKKNRAYLKPYIRRAKPKDFNPKKATSMRNCIIAAFFEDLPKCYVLVQRGSNKVIEFGLSKDDLKQRITFFKKRGRNRRFNKWRNRIKRYAQKKLISRRIENERKNY